MNKAVTNRANMLTSVSDVLETYTPTWQNHVAFAASVAELKSKTVLIDEQAQIVERASGAGTAKRHARAALGRAAMEVIGAVVAYASKNGEVELAAKVRYAPSDVVSGKASEVVARCRAILTEATAIVGDLEDYGITAAKLTAFKKKIDGFDNMRSAPRKDVVARSAAVQLMPVLVRGAVDLIRNELDGLMVQFLETEPSFYEEYFAARVIVNTGGGNNDPAKAPVTPAPTPPAPLDKAA